MILQNADAVDYMISIILNLLHKYTKTFQFKWIKGHSGVTGKELAGTMAKIAEEDTNVTSYFLLYQASYLKYVLKQKIKNYWQKKWDNEDMGRYTQNLLPKVPITLYIKY